MEAGVRRETGEARELLWRFVVGMGVGALAGGVIGGIGTRAAMLVLRLASEDGFQGLDTDDGFVIGRVSTATFFLLTVTAGVGAALGLVYVLVRSALPGRGRSLVVSAFVGLFMGADIVNPNSFDFSALDPKLFAVASFTLLPGFAAFAMVKLVDRLLEVEPWSSRPLSALLVVASLVLNIVLVLVGLVYLALYALRRRSRVAEPVLRIARVVVPIVLVVLTVRAGVELWRDANALL
jgi:hypothetical protein